MTLCLYVVIVVIHTLITYGGTLMDTAKIELYEDEERTGSFLLAQGLGRNHRFIKDLIEKYREQFEFLSTIKTRKLKATGGRPAIEFLLTYDQVTFLISVIRNSLEVIDLKYKMIKATTLVKAMELINDFDFAESSLRYVYAAVDESGRVKIGISNDPVERVKNLNIGNADVLQLVFTKEAKGPGYSDEVKLHRKCEPFKIRSEWFSGPAIEALT